MSGTIPAYSFACLAPDTTGTSLYLVGVPVSNEGRLEMSSVDLTNINSPTVTFVTNQTDSFFWSSSAPKTCLPYGGNQASTNSPVFVQQFGAKSYFTNIYPNGTVDLPANFEGVGYISNKLFSLSGAVANLNWITAVANVSGITTNSPWTGVRYNATDIVESSRDFILSNYPTALPLLSVGTYVASSNTPAQGYHVVFDAVGAGAIYTTLDSAAPILTSLDSILSLSSPAVVDMNGITLTNVAFSLTMANVGYILDKAADGTTVIYSINPSQSTKLQQVSATSNVPSFGSNMAAASVGNNIVIYSVKSNGAVTFNSFDTVALGWSGAGLVKPSVSSTPSSSSTSSHPSNGSSSGSSSGGVSIGAVVGGVAGGLVVIALVVFLFIRNRRASRKTSATTNIQPQGDYQNPSATNPAAAPLINQNYVLQQQQQAMTQNQQYQYQQQQQQQQFDPRQSYILPQQDIYSAQLLTTVPVQQQAQPIIFQPQTQEPYNYTPPTLVPLSQPQSQKPNIFQPQESSPDNLYSQAGYVPPTSAPSPQTPGSQAYTPAHSYTTGASPQYISPSNGDGYAA